MDIETIEKLAAWSAPKEVQTKNGPRMLRKAEPTDAFKSLWKSNKDEMKALGATWTKDDHSGEWSLVWWMPLSAEVVQARQESVIASKAAAADVDLPHPTGFDYMPFQKAGIQYALKRNGVLIGDEMGLGKTIQAIGIINADAEITSALIICPKSLKLNWKRELERWLVRPLTVGIANGVWPDTDIVVTNYESVKKHKETIQSKTWGALVLDEAHYIKSGKTQRSQYIKGRRENKEKKQDAIEPIKATRHIRLTGTPIVNRPSELYNIISDLTPVFGSFTTFSRRYCNGGNNGYGWQADGASNLDELQRRLRETVMVRRLKADVLTELPRKIRQVVEIEPDNAEQRNAVKSESAFESASDERLASLRAAVELSKAESEQDYLEAVERLKDASRVEFTEMARLRHETALAKVPAIITHLEEVLEDDAEKKIILGAHHHDVIDKLMAAAQEHGWNPVTLTGDNTEAERLAAVDAFQKDPSVRVFIGGIQAAGVGITLTASSHVIFAELDWTPGNVTQFEDRAHRIGQTETVLVQHIVLNESLDARMARTIVEKQAIIDSALDVNHPERTAPAYEPKEKAATQSITVEKVAEESLTITTEQAQAALKGLNILAEMDDDAAADKNGVGFSKADVIIGHSLASQRLLTPKQAVISIRLCKKYHRQLPDEIMEIINSAGKES